MNNHEGQTIILLAEDRADRLAGLHHVAGRTGRWGRARMTFADRGDALPRQLTAREILALAAAWYGVEDWHVRVEALLPAAGPSLTERRPAAELPAPEIRVLALLVALLPDPDVMLVEDLTAGLDRPVARHLWEYLRTVARPGRTVVVATGDLTAARVLGDEIWLATDGVVRRGWPRERWPEELRAAEGLALTFDGPAGADHFLARVAPHRDTWGIWHQRRPAPERLEMVVDGRRISALDLAELAGSRLRSMGSHPLPVALLSKVQTDHAGSAAAVMETPPSGQWSKMDAAGRRRAALRLGRLLWRAHFRRFFQVGNLLFSFLLLAPLLILWAAAPELPAAAPFLLPLAAGLLALGPAGESAALWPVRTERSGTLTFLAGAPAGAHIRLLGLTLGVLAIQLTHLLPLVLFGILPGMALSVSGAATAGWWLVWTGVGLPLGLLLGRRRRPAWAGWLLWMPLAVAVTTLLLTGWLATPVVAGVGAVAGVLLWAWLFRTEAGHGLHG